MISDKGSLSAGAGEIRVQMRRRGIRPTQQRLAIAQAILAREQHLSAEQVHALLNREGARVSRATVYNTLKLFSSHGLIRQVVVDSGCIFYDSNTSSHHHIFNEDTGAISDFPTDAIQVRGLPELPPDTVPASIDIVVRIRNRRGA